LASDTVGNECAARLAIECDNGIPHLQCILADAQTETIWFELTLTSNTISGGWAFTSSAREITALTGIQVKKLSINTFTTSSWRR